MRITAHGHPAIKASHAKTFELTEDDEIGPRATCVIGVGARIEGDWPDGPIELTLNLGDHRHIIHAEANPFGRGLVVRKSDFLGADTLAVNADTAASDLDRSFVHALQDPAGALVVSVRALGPAPRRAVFTDAATPPVDGADEVFATTALAHVRACAAVAGSTEAPALLLGDLPRGATARRAYLAAALASAPVVVWRGPAKQAETLLALPGAVTAVDRGEAATRVTLGPPPPNTPPTATVTVAVPGTPTPGDDLTPLLQALKAEGVSARTLRQALARLAQHAGRWDYDALNRL